MKIAHVLEGLIDIAKTPRDEAIDIACHLLGIPTKDRGEQPRDDRGRFGSGGNSSSGRITSEDDDGKPIVVAGDAERDRVQDETPTRVGDSIDDGRQPRSGPPAYARPPVSKPKK
jgi:hypothetical protein